MSARAIPRQRIGCPVCNYLGGVNLITATGVVNQACPCMSDEPKPAWYYKSLYGEWSPPGSDDWKTDRDDRFGVGVPNILAGG